MSDSSAAIAMNTSNKPTKRNRHIDRRYFYGREEFLGAKLLFHHIGADYSLGDLGTKNLQHEESKYKLSIVEYPVSDHHVGYQAIRDLPSESRSKKGDDNNDEHIVDREQLTSHDKLTTYTTDGTHTRARHMDRIQKDVDLHTHGYAHEVATRTKQNEMQKTTYTGRATETDLSDTHASKDVRETSKATEINERISPCAQNFR
jgi:hypothetical protein